MSQPNTSPNCGSSQYGNFHKGPREVNTSRKPIYENYEWPDKKINPHCEQCLHYSMAKVVQNPFTKDSRILQPTDPELSYAGREDEMKSVIHWGQRKLLMSEIEFLTEYSRPGQTVVDAGAAPGHHTNFLSTMFPDLFFVLVDPSPFCCHKTDKIKIIQDFFTDELAEKYSDQDVLFISDIRTWQPEKRKKYQAKQQKDEVERCVDWDHQAQMNWHNTIKPSWSMLKFRLPYATSQIPSKKNMSNQYHRHSNTPPQYGRVNHTYDPARRGLYLYLETNPHRLRARERKSSASIPTTNSNRKQKVTTENLGKKASCVNGIAKHY